MIKSKRILALSMAVVLGAGFFAFQSYGQSTTLVIMCFRDRTVQVPTYLVNTDRAQGADFGACPTSP